MTSEEGLYIKLRHLRKFFQYFLPRNSSDINHIILSSSATSNNKFITSYVLENKSKNTWETQFEVFTIKELCGHRIQFFSYEIWTSSLYEFVLLVKWEMLWKLNTRWNRIVCDMTISLKTKKSRRRNFVWRIVLKLQFA